MVGQSRVTRVRGPTNLKRDLSGSHGQQVKVLAGCQEAGHVSKDLDRWQVAGQVLDDLHGWQGIGLGQVASKGARGRRHGTWPA